MPLRLGPREANCLFVLRVYGLSAAQLTGNLNLEEKKHINRHYPPSGQALRIKQARGGSCTQPTAVLSRAASQLQGKEGGKKRNPSPPHLPLEPIASQPYRSRMMCFFSCSAAFQVEEIDLKAMCECREPGDPLGFLHPWLFLPERCLGGGVRCIGQCF